MSTLIIVVAVGIIILAVIKLTKEAKVNDNLRVVKSETASDLNSFLSLASNKVITEADIGIITILIHKEIIASYLHTAHTLDTYEDSAIALANSDQEEVKVNIFASLEENIKGELIPYNELVSMTNILAKGVEEIIRKQLAKI